jgi:hypothetical protein
MLAKRPISRSRQAAETYRLAACAPQNFTISAKSNLTILLRNYSEIILDKIAVLSEQERE